MSNSKKLIKNFMNNIICDNIKEMSSVAIKYRKEHPEYCERRKEEDKERGKILYHNNPE